MFGFYIFKIDLTLMLIIYVIMNQEEKRIAHNKNNRDYYHRHKHKTEFKEKRKLWSKEGNRSENGIKTRKKHVWKKYGIKFVDFDLEYEKHNNTSNCDCCNKEFDEKQKRYLDHDHKSGYIRFTVCNICNTKLGVVDRIRNNLHLELHRYSRRQEV